MEKKFNNKPNDHVVYGFNSEATGVKIHQDFWVSRSVAVDALVFALVDDDILVIAVERSNKMRDEPGKYGIPCGYLDWDETLYDAMLRELYEETSLYLPDYQDLIGLDLNKQPFMIKDNPKNNHQNISVIYFTLLDFRKQNDRWQKFKTIINFTCKETAGVHLLDIKLFESAGQIYNWAFNQDELIRKGIIHLKNMLQKHE